MPFNWIRGGPWGMMEEDKEWMIEGIQEEEGKDTLRVCDPSLRPTRV